MVEKPNRVRNAIVSDDVETLRLMQEASVRSRKRNKRKAPSERKVKKVRTRPTPDEFQAEIARRYGD